MRYINRHNLSIYLPWYHRPQAYHL